MPAGLEGDSVALGWLATTRRPLLIVHGRALFEDDPAEWGSVCLELLHRTLAKADLSEVKRLRRRVVRELIVTCPGSWVGTSTSDVGSS